MRQVVYEKFAGALLQKKAEDRRQYVRGRLAATISAQQMRKSAAPLRSLESLGKLEKVLRGLMKARIKASPKINTEGWSKYDPRRLFLTKRQVGFGATNYRPDPSKLGPVTRGSGSAYGAYGAYSGGGGNVPGGIKTFGELSRVGGTGFTHRLSPGKILAALGILGGSAAALSKATESPKPAPTPTIPPQVERDATDSAATADAVGNGVPEEGQNGALSEFWERVSGDPRVQRALASLTAAGVAARDKTQDIMSRIQAAHGLHVGLAGAGGLAIGGAGGYALGSQGDSKKKRKRNQQGK